MKKWLSQITHSFNVEVNRNSFDTSKTRNASYNFGRVYPIFLRAMDPNESVRIKVSGGFDLKPMIGVCQTHVRCHTAWAFVRIRELWKNSSKFFMQDPTVSTSSVSHPVINTDDKSAFRVGSLLHHLGVPMSTIGVYQSNAVVSVVDSDFEQITVPGVDFLNYARRIYAYSTSFAYSFIRRSYDSWPSDPSGDLFCHMTRAIVLGSAFSGIVYPFLSQYLTDSRAVGLSSVVYPCPMTKLVSSQYGWYFDFLHVNQISNGTPVSMPTNSNYYLSFYDFDSVNHDGNLLETFLFSYTPSSSSHGQYSITSPMSKNVSINGNEYLQAVLCHLRLTPNRDCIEKIRSLQQTHSGLIAVLSFPSNASVGTNGVYAGNFNRVVPADETKPVYYNVTAGFVNGFSYQSDVLVNTDVSSPFLGLGDAAKAHLNALPVRAYEAFMNSHFRNRDLDPFRVDGEIAVDRYNTNQDDGLDSTTPLSLFRCQYEGDYFTTCMPSPQGNMFNQPLVGITVASNPDANMAVATYSEEGQTYNVEFRTDGDGKMIGMNYNSEDANRLTVLTLKDAIQYGISLHDLENRRALSKWYEATYRRGRFSFDDFVGAHFGKVPTSDAKHAPEYLGGTSLPLSMMRILNNSTADGGILGQSGGLGSFASKEDSPDVIECFADVHGFILGVCWFSVTPTYGQAIDKMWYRQIPSDYATPEFANLGTMPVLNKEICPLQCDWDDSTAEDAANGTFGYQRIYGDKLFAFDDIAGDYADELNPLILYRKFHRVPKLSADFVYQSPDDLNNVFVLDDDADKIYGQWHFDVTSKLWLQQRPNAQIF